MKDARCSMDKQFRALAVEAGVTYVSTTWGHTNSHAKVRCEHHGYHFHIVVNGHTNGRDQKWRQNVVKDFRLAKRAVEQKDPTLLRKYLGSRSQTCTNTSTTKCADTDTTTPSKSASRKKTR